MDAMQPAEEIDHDRSQQSSIDGRRRFSSQEVPNVATIRTVVKTTTATQVT